MVDYKSIIFMQYTLNMHYKKLAEEFNTLNVKPYFR